MSEKKMNLVCRVVDEKTGGIFLLSTDGETFSLIPKYDSGFDSLMRFYRFIVEKIDPNATIKMEGDFCGE